MGPNGSGKSTLGNSLLGHPAYQVTKGSVLLGQRNILSLPTEQRAALGLFLAFQHPLAIPGVPLATFLKTAQSAIRTTRKLPVPTAQEFLTNLKQSAQQLNIKPEFLHRPINEGLSGGERKKIETLQLLMLEPKFIILDELDTGTDVDALKTIGQTLDALKGQASAPGIIIITHYNRIFKYIKPQAVHVIKDGVIVASGDYSLVAKIDKHGYNQW